MPSASPPGDHRSTCGSKQTFHHFSPQGRQFRNHDVSKFQREFSPGHGRTNGQFFCLPCHPTPGTQHPTVSSLPPALHGPAKDARKRLLTTGTQHTHSPNPIGVERAPGRPIDPKPMKPPHDELVRERSGASPAVYPAPGHQPSPEPFKLSWPRAELRLRRNQREIQPMVRSGHGFRALCQLLRAVQA